MRRHLLFGSLAWALAFSSAQAAYIGNPLTVLDVNIAQQPVGSPTINGQPPNPLVNQPQAQFAPSTSGPVFQRQALFGDTTGRLLDVLTDGVTPISIALPNKSAAPANPALVVALSPTPNYQCPYISAINASANVTQITNPGGKRIFVCNVVVINGGTAQSVTLLEGTGTACATNPINWLGGAGATAALAINGGFSLMGVNYAMQTAGDNVCVLISGSTNISGSLTYGLY